MGVNKKTGDTKSEMMGLLSSLILFLPYWGWPLWVETRKVGIEPCCIILWKLAGGFFMLQASICGRISAELSTWCLELAQNLLGHRGWVHPKSEKSFFLWDLDRKLSFFCSCSLSFFFRCLNIWKTHLRMPVCALVNEKIFCVHGGISPELKNLDQIRQLERRGRLSMDGSGKAVKKCWISHGRYIILHHVISCPFLNIFVHQMNIYIYIYIWMICFENDCVLWQTRDSWLCPPI